MDSQCSRGRRCFELYLSQGNVEQDLLEYASKCMSQKLKEFYEPMDVLQQAYLEAWKRFEFFLRRRGQGEFPSWLRSFVKHEALKTARSVRRIRKEQRRTNGRRQGGIDIDTDWIQDPPDPRPGPAELLLSREKTDLVNEAIQRLTWRQMSLLQRVHLEGLSTKEAGSMLGLEPSSASKCLERGRLRIRELLERSFGESAR